MILQVSVRVFRLALAAVAFCFPAERLARRPGRTSC